MDRTYQQCFQADGSFLFIEIREDGFSRQVDSGHQGLLAWLAAGNVPESVPYVAPDPSSLDELKAARKARIEAKRDAVIAAGVRVDFPDGSAVIQTRDERDIRNIQGVAAQGLACLVTGQAPEPGQLVFRDAENALHAMTPAQAVAFGRQAAQAIQAVYAVSWAKKADVDGLAAPEAIQAYDPETGWPVPR